MSVTTIGFTEFAAKLDGLPKEVLEEVDINVFDAAKLWEELAKIAAPHDAGFLAGAILGDKIDFLEAEVVSPKFYSPYQEWGTGERVSIPPELIAYAAQFRKTKRVLGIPPYKGVGYFFRQRKEVEEFLFDHIQIILNTEH